MLQGKLIVVTGGAGLLGKRFCAAIAARGAAVVVADFNLPAATECAGRIADSGGKAEPARLDITQTSSVQALIDDLHRRYGHIDAVVNNAYPRNANYGRKLEEVTYEDFCDNVRGHLGGYFLVAQRFALYFRRQGFGQIVNISSIYGVMPPRFEVYEGTSMTMPVEYAAIKSAVLQLTKYFAQYFKKDGIRVNALSPGGVLNGQPAAFLNAYQRMAGTKGMLDVDDLTGALLFLLSEESRFVTGQNLVVDDGFSL